MTEVVNGTSKVPAVRTMVRGTYDLQKLRIAVGNRVVGNFKAKLGQAPGERADDTLSKEAKKFLADLKKRHKRIADALIENPHEGPFPGDELISTFTEFALVGQYVDLERIEKTHFQRLEVALDAVPIYRNWLKHIVGIGPAMAGVIVSEFDIYKARYPSSLWAYGGLDVVSDVDGFGRSKRKPHLVKRTYTNRKGEEDERDSITFNPFLKTKLMGVLGPNFLRSKSPYADFYKQRKHRLETNPNLTLVDKPGFHMDKTTYTKMRRHEASIRYMVKMFLIDLYVQWRTMEGLPLSQTYHEAKMGHRHRRAS